MTEQVSNILDRAPSAACPAYLDSYRQSIARSGKHDFFWQQRTLDGAYE